MILRTMIDHATLASTAKVLDHPEEANDVDFAALTLLVESIVLHDELIVPNLPHFQAENIHQRFGDLILFKNIPDRLVNNIESSGVDWVKEYSSATKALELAGFRFQGLYFGSQDHALAVQFGLSESQARQLRERALSDRSVDELAAIHLFESKQEADALVVKEKMNNLITDWLSALKWKELREQLKPDVSYLFNFAMEMDGEPPSGITIPVAEYLSQIYWTLFRSREYEHASRILNVDYSPHPVRSIACAVSRVDSDVSNRQCNTLKVISTSLRKVHDEGLDYINNKLGVVIKPLVIAPLFPYVVTRMKTGESILSAALRVRDTKQAKELRAIVNDATTAIRSGDLTGVRFYAAKLDAIEHFIRSEAGISRTQTSAQLSVLGLTVPIPERVETTFTAISTGVSVSTLLFLRDVFFELQRAASLGSYRDIVVNRQ